MEECLCCTGEFTRWAGACYEAEQSVCTKYGDCDCVFLEKTATEYTTCREMPPSSPGVSPMVPRLACSESTHFYRHVDTKYATVFTILAQTDKQRK